MNAREERLVTFSLTQAYIERLVRSALRHTMSGGPFRLRFRYQAHMPGGNWEDVKPDGFRIKVIATVPMPADPAAGAPDGLPPITDEERAQWGLDMDTYEDRPEDHHISQVPPEQREEDSRNYRAPEEQAYRDRAPAPDAVLTSGCVNCGVRSRDGEPLKHLSDCPHQTLTK